MKLGNILIYGDSYSTYKDHIPVGYACYYNPTAREGAPFLPSVADTWWYPIVTAEGNRLIENNSWSGSTVCHTGWQGADTSETSSFIYRMEKHIAEGLFEKEKVDTILVFGLTNDNWSNAPLGEKQFENFEKKDLFYVLPAIAYMIKRLKEIAPTARLVWIVNTDFKSEINEAIKEACARFGAEALFLPPVEKESGHPTVKGMAQITAEIEAFMA